jgi:hypothetical protein
VIVLLSVHWEPVRSWKNFASRLLFIPLIIDSTNLTGNMNGLLQNSVM